MKRKRLILAAALVALTVLWFLAVDWSWFVDDCPSCGLGRDVAQYRVFGIPVHERAREYHTPLELVARDLGVACSHPEMTRWHKHRWWGLCICAYPRINGINGLTSDASWYDETVAAKVRQLGRANPSLGNEFARRALEERDMDYWKAFVEQLEDAGISLE